MIITDPIGLHARPASTVVNLAKNFKSHLKIFYKNKYVDMKSIIGVMSMAVATNEVIKIVAEGIDEEEAIENFKVSLAEYDIAKEL